MHVIKPVALQFIKLASISHQASSMGQSSSQFHDSHQANSHQDDLAMSSNHSNQKSSRQFYNRHWAGPAMVTKSYPVLIKNQARLTKSHQARRHNHQANRPNRRSNWFKSNPERTLLSRSHQRVIKPAILGSHQVGPATNSSSQSLQTVAKQILIRSHQANHTKKP